MKIKLDENKFSSLMGNLLYENFTNQNPIKQQSEISINSLKQLLNSDGIIMTNVENGKDYKVYEITSLANTIGKRFVITQLIKDGDLYGQLSVKPLTLFKMKNY
jgi:hypothetical protein